MWLLRLCCWLGVLVTWITPEVTVEHNAYQGLVVSISPRVRVAPNQEREFITNLKGIIDLLSQSLSTSIGLNINTVFIIIPSSWETPTEITSILKTHEDADIAIELGPGVFQNNPFTIQHQGCFRTGKRIVLPDTFITEETENNFLKGKRLLQEWTQYRYGVFKEHGFLYDNFYPLYYAIPGLINQTLITKCNEGIHFPLKTVNGEECRPDFDQNTGRERSDYCHYSYDKNSESVYSFMSHPLVNRMQHFCGKEVTFRHNAEAPSKQNVLCHELDTYSVISKHKDYTDIKLLRNAPTYYKPKFFVHKLQPLRIVLAVDDSNYMNLEFVHTYIKTFIQHDIPQYDISSSKLDLLLFHERYLERTRDLLADNRQLGPFSTEETNNPACLHCAIEKGMSMLQDLGVLVVVGSLQSLTDKVKSIDPKLVKVFLILFYSPSPDIQLDELDMWAQKSGGKLFVIFDGLEDNYISPGTHLYQIFNHIAQLMTPEKNVTIHHQEIIGTGEVTKIVFHVPKYLKSIQIKFTELAFFIYEPVTLKRPNGQVYLNLFFDRFQSTPEHEEGEWSLVLRTSKAKKFHILITGQSSDEKSAIKIDPWVDSSQNSIVNLFAEINQGIHPVVADAVRAFIYCDSVFIQTVNMLDDGIGYPDVTARDGVYSAALNLTEFELPYKYCTMIVKAEFSEKSIIIGGLKDFQRGQQQQPFGDYICCGSTIPNIGQIPLGVFYLQALPITFTLSPMKAPKPIGAITNLRVFEINHKQETVKLSWTDPFTSTDLVSYVVKCSMDRDLLKTNFDDINDTVVEDVFDTGEKSYPQYKYYGYPQTIAILLKEVYLRVNPNWSQAHQPLFFAIKIKTLDDRLGSISNIVTAYIDPLKPTEEPITNSTLVQDKDEEGKDNTILIVIVVCSVFLSLTIFIIIFICCFIKRRRRRLEETEDETSSTYKSADLTIHTISNGTLDNKNTVNPVNPIGSWPADVLMDHYGKVQEAKSKRVDPPIISTEQLIENLSNIHHGTPSINSLTASDFSSDNESQGSHSSRRVTQV